MQRIERIVILGGVVAAILIALSASAGGGRALAWTPGEAPDSVKIATVDMYWVIEKIMAKDEYKKEREDVSATWTRKAQEIERQLKELDSTLQVLPQNDPQVQTILKQAQDRQAEYQRVQSDRQQELERLNSGQLINTYKTVRDVSAKVAERMGYSHVFCNRSSDRAINTTTVGATLQELLARPLIRGGDGADDLTKAVLQEMKLPLD
ncbi:MAG: OmpH family outer membrane protein [Phycisphaerae bacterium]|nr:OmpH family outer membrane protein [Phycisphaerae bacterium]